MLNVKYIFNHYSSLEDLIVTKFFGGDLLIERKFSGAFWGVLIRGLAHNEQC